MPNLSGGLREENNNLVQGRNELQTQNTKLQSELDERMNKVQSENRKLQKQIQKLGWENARLENDHTTSFGKLSVPGNVITLE